MAVNFQQTDNLASNSGQANCSGTGEASSIGVREAVVAGTPSSNSFSATLLSSATSSWPLFRCTVAAGVTWAAGTWTVRWNVGTANMNLTVSEVHICRANSSNVNQATIGSATGLSVSMGTTGVKSQTVSGASQTPAANDTIFVVLVIVNGAMSSQSLQVVLDQLIDSPFAEAAVEKPSNRNIYNVSQAVNRASTY